MDEKINECLNKLQLFQSNTNLAIIKQLEEGKTEFEQRYLEASKQLDAMAKEKLYNRELEDELNMLKVEYKALETKYQEMQKKQSEGNNKIQSKASDANNILEDALEMQKLTFIQRENVLQQQINDMSVRFNADKERMENHFKLILNEHGGKMKKIIAANYKLNNEITSMTATLHSEKTFQTKDDTKAVAFYKQQLAESESKVARLRQENANLQWMLAESKSTDNSSNGMQSHLFPLAERSHDSRHTENLQLAPSKASNHRYRTAKPLAVMPGISLGKENVVFQCNTNKLVQATVANTNACNVNNTTITTSFLQTNMLVTVDTVSNDIPRNTSMYLPSNNDKIVIMPDEETREIPKKAKKRKLCTDAMLNEIVDDDEYSSID